MDNWLIFQSLFFVAISWGGTKLDNSSGALKMHTFNQQVSSGWQIRQNVIRQAVNTILTARKGELSDFSFREKRRNETINNPYLNRHR